MNVIADAGYSNGEQAEACEGKGILPHVPSNRAINNQGDGTFFDRTAFQYQEQSDTFLCPAGQTLTRKQLARKTMVGRRLKSTIAVPPSVMSIDTPVVGKCRGTDDHLVVSDR